MIENIFQHPNRLQVIKEALQAGSQASDQACYSGAQFIIGNALHGCFFEDDLGKVQTNLAFVWPSPSSTFKTPLMRILRTIYERDWRNQGLHFKSKYTTEGLMQSLYNYRKKIEERAKKEKKIEESLNEDRDDFDDEINIPAYKCIVLRDEASNLAKEAKAGRAANIWEFQSEAYDGFVSPYDTVRGSSQTYPPTWMSFWFSSTLTLYQHLGDDFWEQGFAFRCLFIRPEKKEYLPMSNNVVRETAILDITTELLDLYEIEGALASDEWWSAYNDFVKPIVERGNIEIDSLDSAENIPIEDKADKKYPEIVIKLSMVHCASRSGWKETDGHKYLWLDLQDLQNAISDLHKYKENLISAYNIYQLRKKSPAKLEKIEEERKTVHRLIKEAPPEQRYDAREEYGDDKKTHIFAVQSKDGKYIRSSYIYRKTRWSKSTVNSVLGAMGNAEEIELIATESDGTNRKTILIGEVD